MKYDFFISHSSKDSAFSGKLKTDLILKGYKVWIEEKLNLAQGLMGSSRLSPFSNFSYRYIFIILTPDYFNDIKTNQELSLALKKEFDTGEIYIILIYYKNCEIPEVLKNKDCLDFRDETKFRINLEKLYSKLDGLLNANDNNFNPRLVSKSLVTNENSINQKDILNFESNRQSVAPAPSKSNNESKNIPSISVSKHEVDTEIKILQENQKVNSNETRIFISYSHKQSQSSKIFIDKLKSYTINHPVYKINIWDDDQIFIGEDWHKKIQIEIERSNLCILLLCQDFFNSKYIKNHELKNFLKQNEKDGYPILPILLGDYMFQDHEAILANQIFMPDASLFDDLSGDKISFNKLIYRKTKLIKDAINSPNVDTYFKHFRTRLDRVLDGIYSKLK